MEIVRGNKIKNILLDRSNWQRFFSTFSDRIRDDIVTNIIKVMTCGTVFLGYHVYQCGNCNAIKAVFHTCKSRFCPSCGKKATDNWIKKHLEILPHTTYQHITFTFPQSLQPLFWLNRHLFNKLMPIPAALITKCARKMGVIPGIFVAMHTFGRDLKRNLHFHLSTTLSGISPNKTTWMQGFRFNRKALVTIKLQWRDSIISILRQELLENNLTLPNNFSRKTFLEYLDSEAEKPWVVHFAKPSENQYQTVNYLGRYLKRPPIGETRIKDYDGENVTFAYFDHHEKKEHHMKIPSFDFISRLIAHIPDRHFRVVRYYNWLSTRTRNQYLPLVYEALKQIVKKSYNLSWRALYTKTVGTDPLQCEHCKNATLTLISCVYTNCIKKLKAKHKEVSDPKNYSIA